MTSPGPGVEEGVSGWTVDTLREYHAALRAADERLSAERDRRITEVTAERDRRYAEVALGREQALKIKEEADREALRLERETQTYKDRQANDLRQQINSERGLYATKADLQSTEDKLEALIRPALNFISGQIGNSTGKQDYRNTLLVVAGLLIAVLGVIVTR